MIGDSVTRAHKPRSPELDSGLFLGAVSAVSATTSVSLRTRAFDDFSAGVDDWVNVRGKLTTTGGESPDITADSDLFDPLSWVAGAAGYHRTEMLTDSVRVKVTIPDGAIVNGTSQFWFCGDEEMTHYYGVEVSTVLGVSSLSIIKGTSPNSWQRFETTLTPLTAGDSVEGWYDHEFSVIRMYHEGSEIAAMSVAPTDIPHGPGRRRVGVIMAADWWIAPGGNFADFEAWDVDAPVPAIRDTIDGPGVDAGWDVVSGGLAIHQWPLRPNTLGPDFPLAFQSAAAVRDVEVGSDSVRVVINVLNRGAGKFTVVLCSDAEMTNWIGIQFETGLVNNKVHTCLGTGPTTYTRPGDSVWQLTENGAVFTVIYDHPSKRISLFKGQRFGSPIISLVDSGNAVTHGAGNRHVGCVWEASALAPGVEPAGVEVFEVSDEFPLPPYGVS